MREMRRRVPLGMARGKPRPASTSACRCIGRGRRAFVKGQVHQRGGQIFDRAKPHVEGRGFQHLCRSRRRHRFARLHMRREFGQDGRHLQPVFVKLAGQFNEIAGDGGARNRFVVTSDSIWCSAWPNSWNSVRASSQDNSAGCPSGGLTKLQMFRTCALRSPSRRDCTCMAEHQAPECLPSRAK